MIAYKNKKNGEIYYVLLDNVINSTNKNDGEIMILYMKNGIWYIRERNEFYEKFEEIINQI